MGRKNQENYFVKEKPLTGSPDFRTKPGLTGLDPLEQSTKGGFATGLILQNLIKGRLRTRNPFYLAMMLIFGLGGLLFIIPIITFHPILIILVAIPFSIGFLLVANFVINVRRIYKHHRSGKKLQHHKTNKQTTRSNSSHS